MNEFFYFVDVHIIAGSNLMRGTIIETKKCMARLIKDREVLYPAKYPNGLHAGVRRGGKWVMTKEDYYGKSLH